MMSHELHLVLPDDVYTSLVRLAKRRGQTPEDWLVRSLRRRLVKRDLKLRRHFGAIHTGSADSANNEQIDKDLTRAYALTTDQHFDQAGFVRLLEP
jgi:hypothetical protein